MKGAERNMWIYLELGRYRENDAAKRWGLVAAQDTRTVSVVREVSPPLLHEIVFRFL